MSSQSLMQWWEGVKGGSSAMRAKGHVVEAGRSVRAVGEGVIVGGILGAANASLAGGLDQHVGLSPFPVPLDGMVAGAAMLGAIALGNEEGGVGVSQTLRGVAAAGATVWSFRKSDQFVRGKQGVTNAIKSIGKPKAHGEFGAESAPASHVDPILTAGQSL